MHAIFDASGRKASHKERWRESIWGQKTSKLPPLLCFCCYVTHFALRKIRLFYVFLFECIYRGIVTLWSLHVPVSPSLFIFPCHCKCQPLPPDFSSSFPTTLSFSISVTLPFISFKGEGRYLILGYLPISMMAARSLSAHLLLISASSQAGFTQLKRIVAVV